MDQSLPPAAQFINESDAEPFDPELEKARDVWRRVLFETIVDYLFKRSTSQDFKDAQYWLFYGPPASNSFESVCSYVGYSANVMRPMISSLRAARLKHPERLEALMVLLHGCGIRSPK